MVDLPWYTDEEWVELHGEEQENKFNIYRLMMHQASPAVIRGINYDREPWIDELLEATNDVLIGELLAQDLIHATDSDASALNKLLVTLAYRLLEYDVDVIMVDSGFSLRNIQNKKTRKLLDNFQRGTVILYPIISTDKASNRNLWPNILRLKKKGFRVVIYGLPEYMKLTKIPRVRSRIFEEDGIWQLFHQIINDEEIKVKCINWYLTSRAANLKELFTLYTLIELFNSAKIITEADVDVILTSIDDGLRVYKNNQILSSDK